MDGFSGISRAGFVLVGGLSSRMGRDKALLPFEGSTLAGEVASRVRLAAGNVALIGPPHRYAALGFPVTADLVEGCGPLGGVYTALRITQAEWNLIVACDMPAVTADFLRDLLERAEASAAECMVPESATGLDPLCAVYHRRCLAAAEDALRRKSFTMHDFVSSLRTATWSVPDRSALENVNTPDQWGSR